MEICGKRQLCLKCLQSEQCNKCMILLKRNDLTSPVYPTRKPFSRPWAILAATPKSPKTVSH